MLRKFGQRFIIDYYSYFYDIYIFFFAQLTERKQTALKLLNYTYYIVKQTGKLNRKK